MVRGGHLPVLWKRDITSELGTRMWLNPRLVAQGTALTPGATHPFTRKVQRLDREQVEDFGNYAVGALPP